MLIDLRDKVAIVTGAGRGIGREIALTLAREGAKTIGTDVDQDNLADLGAELAKYSLDGRQHRCDVRDSSQVQGVVDQAVEEYGRIDILVNNAGIVSDSPVDRLAEESWDAVMDVNLKGSFLFSKAVAPVMKRQKSGRIINAASFAAIIPRAGTGAYAPSKAGVVYLTKILAAELGPWNVTVNCYAPGMVPTSMNHYDEQPEEQQERNLDMLTLRRWGSMSDVANVVCFLASDLASYVTGTLIDVSGGKLATQVPRDPYDWRRAES